MLVCISQIGTKAEHFLKVKHSSWPNNQLFCESDHKIESHCTIKAYKEQTGMESYGGTGVVKD